MKKLLTLLSLLAMFTFAGCESLGSDDVIEGNNEHKDSYSINGTIQKGPFVQGSSITIQPLNKNLKPIGQMYTTQTTNDAGMFEMDEINSKYVEIIATGYYFDEVVGAISVGTLTMRSIADLEDGAQTNVNLLTTLTYNRIKNLVTNEDKGISEAQEQAEKELYTALGIPEELHPGVSCGAMNIANNGEGDGLLLAISAVLQEGRTTGELSEYIAKFSTDLADDGAVAQTLLDKFNLDGGHFLRFEDNIKNNLKVRYEALGVDCKIPEFSQYLPYLGTVGECFVIPFTYYEDKNEVFPHDPDLANSLKGIEEGIRFSADVDYLGYDYRDGSGVIYLSAAPTIINRVDCDVLRTIDIPNSVTSIGDYAFAYCSSLASVSIPNSVTSIGDWAFQSCESLASVSIPNSVTSIGECAFESCVSLASVTIPDSVTSIGERAFSCCLSLASVTIHDSVTSIGACAFDFCSSLVDITIPDSVTSIGAGTFSYCSSLESVTLPESLTSIENWLFDRCTSLTSITIPDSVTSIGLGAFFGCGSLKSITIPEGVTSIERETFYGCVSLKSITIPDNVTSIGEWAFRFCESLTNVIIGDGVIEIETAAFESCISLVSVTLGDSIFSIGSSVFCDCPNLAEFKGRYASADGRCFIVDGVLFYAAPAGLTTYVIPDGVTEIKESAFCDCSSLESVTLPGSVTKIGHYAFRYCTSLKEVYCKPTTPPGLTSIYVFPDSVQKFYVPIESVSAYKSANYWSNYGDAIDGYYFE